MDEERWEKIACRNCGSCVGPFSKRQMKLWTEAKCTPCLQQLMNHHHAQEMDNSDKDKKDATIANKVHHEEEEEDEEERQDTPEENQDETLVSTKRRKINESAKSPEEEEEEEDTGEKEEEDNKNNSTEVAQQAAATATRTSTISTGNVESKEGNESSSTILRPHTTTTTTPHQHDLPEEPMMMKSGKITDPVAMVSINAMKRKIMRRDLETNEDDDEEEDCTKKTLFEELSCVICHELLYDPISLPKCGHSFCSSCWIWWEAKSGRIVSCPTCRTVTTNTTTNMETTWKPTRALQVAIAALFPDAIADRKLSFAGENEGKHRLGNAVILPLQQQAWTMISSGALKIRRSIVLDETDQCMVYGLAVQDVSWEGSTVHISVCRLHMEQDEAAEGFPVHITDDDDEFFIVSHDTSIIAVFDSEQGPVARQTISSGFIELREMHLATKCYSIRHESTGCELQIQATGDVVISENTNKYNNTARSMVHEGYWSSDDDEELESAEMEDDEEEKDFLVEEDMCQICNDGGELIVCDGGGDGGGCTRSFHIACIGRNEVPPGDWICQDCAAENGIVTGLEGHEYPEKVDDDDDDDEQVFAQFSGDDNEEEDDCSNGGQNPPVASSQPKRVMLVDSSDEEESDSSDDGESEA